MPTTPDYTQFLGFVGRLRVVPSAAQVISFGPSGSLIFQPEHMAAWYEAQTAGGQTLTDFCDSIRAAILEGVPGPHVLHGDPPSLLHHFDPGEETIRRVPAPNNAGYWYALIRMPRTE